MTVTRYLLDTNTCISIVNRRPAKVFERFAGLHIGEIAISRITGAELAFGVAKSGSPRNQQALDKFLAPLEILPFDETAMRRYGMLRSELERRGTPIGALDQHRGTCPGFECNVGEQQSARIPARRRTGTGELAGRSWLTGASSARPLQALGSTESRTEPAQAEPRRTPEMPSMAMPLPQASH